MKTSEFPQFPNCFVCGQENDHGLHTHWQSDEEKVTSQLTTQDWMAGYEDVVHGGIISSVLDEAVIWASYASTGLFGVTAELNVRFLKPVHIGQTYTIQGWLTEQKGRMHIAEAILSDSTQKIMARATAKILPVKNS